MTPDGASTVDSDVVLDFCFHPPTPVSSFSRCPGYTASPGSATDGYDTTPSRRTAPGVEQRHTRLSIFNMYRSMLHSLQAKEDLAFVFNGIATLLNNVPYAEKTLLPYSTKQVACHQEVLVLLWKFLDENQAFKACVLCL